MSLFGAKEIRKKNFLPTFKIKGQVYHRVDSFLPPSDQNPQFLQIYFISDAKKCILPQKWLNKWPKTHVKPLYWFSLSSVMKMNKQR